MLAATCHGGMVRIELLRKPRTLTECDCSICWRRGERWAYFSRRSVRFDFAQRDVAYYRYRTKTFRYCHCRRCGCVTHYERVGTGDDDDRLANNARMVDPPESIAGVAIRQLTWRWRRRAGAGDNTL